MKQFGQGSKSRAWGQKAKSRSLMDRYNGTIDGDRVQSKRSTLEDLGSMFESSRLGALMIGELHGEQMLPRDADHIAKCQLVGIVERDSQLSELVEISDVFSVTKADFASGDWVFVMADTVSAEVYKLAMK